MIETYVKRDAGYKFNFYGNPNDVLHVGDIFLVWADDKNKPYGFAAVTNVFKYNSYSGIIMWSEK